MCPHVGFDVSQAILRCLRALYDGIRQSFVIRDPLDQKAGLNSVFWMNNQSMGWEQRSPEKVP